MSPTLELNFWTRLLGILALEIGLVVVLAFAVQSFTQSAFWRRTIWQICFVCLLLLVVTELTGFGRGLAVWISGKPVAERKFSIRNVPLDEQFVPQSVENESPAPVLIPQIESTPVTRTVWWPGIIWLAGLGLIVARILFARCLFFTLRFQREKINDPNLLERVSELAKRLGIRRKIHLLESNGLSSPMTFGITHPSIGLPSGFAQTLNSAQQDAMLTHELAHLAARDPFWYLLADLAAAFLWWHPLVWLARRRLHSTSELAADEAAAILENGPGTLAECLVQLGQQLTQARSFGWLGVDGNGFRSHLGQRVERLLSLKEASQPSRGWKILFAKTSLTILFAAVAIFTSGWIQNKGEHRPKNWKNAIQQSWNNSFASLAVIALAESRTSEAAETQPLVSYETVSFDTVFYDYVSLEKFERISRTALDLEDTQSVWILSSNDLHEALISLSELPRTYDSVGNKFSGGHFLYQGIITNGNTCEWITEKENGINRVKGAEMTYASTNLWSFSFVPQKLESYVQINLRWPDETDELAKKIEMPVNGGAIVRRALPSDPTRCQLILFSSARVFLKERDEKIAAAVATLIQDCKLLFEIGKLEEAEVKLNEALKIDAENKIAFYYKSLIKKAKLAQARPRAELIRPTIPPTTLNKIVVPHATNNPASRDKVVYTSKGRQAIKAKLDRIRLSEVLFENLSLGEVLKVLRTESKKRDPDEVGINFMFNPRPNAPAAPTNDPNAAVRTPASSPAVDLNKIMIHISPSLKDIRLADALDAIVQVAEQPLEYKIEDYAVIFSPKTPEAIKLYTRVFKLDSKKFLKHLENFPVSKTELRSNPQLLDDWSSGGGVTKTNFSVEVNMKVRKLLEAAGVGFDALGNTNGKSVFFKDREGLLMVRASQEDLGKIQNAIQTFGAETPQITIEAKFVEIDQAASKALGFDWLPANTLVPLETNRISSKVIPHHGSKIPPKLKGDPTNSLTTMVTGILTESQYRTALKNLEKRGGVDILSAPKVTTLTGRQTQISVLDMMTVVTGISSVKNGDGISTNTFETQSLPFGPVLDIIPSVSAEGFSIQMTIIATVTEFLGYDKPEKVVQKLNPSAQIPLPRTRIRQATTSANVWDGQTIVLGGMMDQVDKTKKASARKNLLVFVTATIIDAAGNRVHTDEELPFVTNSVPKQAKQN